jgi:hypothetical protein
LSPISCTLVLQILSYEKIICKNYVIFVFFLPNVHQYFAPLLPI